MVLLIAMSLSLNHLEIMPRTKKVCINDILGNHTIAKSFNVVQASRLDSSGKIFLLPGESNKLPGKIPHLKRFNFFESLYRVSHANTH